MRKVITLAIVIPLVIVIVTFAVANRAAITVSFDPFDPVHPALAMTLPLFVLIFVLLGLGVLVGGVAAWLKQHKWRTRARRAEAEARELRERLSAGQSARSLTARAEPSPPLAVPPAA